MAEAAIQGRIIDPSGAPVTGARVRVEPAGLTAVSGARGEFDLRSPGGETLLVVEAASFERAVVAVTPGQTEVNVTLRVKALPQQITVTATGAVEDLEESARATSVISRDALDARGEFSLVEALREMPGVRVTQTGGPGALANIRLRGLRAQDTAVLIDGLRLRDTAAPQGDATGMLAELTPLNIDRVEVMRGVGSALHGSNAMGGVVNILSGTGGGPLRADWLGEGGGLGFFRSQLRASGGTERWSGAGGLAHINVRDGADGNDPARNSTAQGTTQYRVKPALVLSGRLWAVNSFVGLNGSPSLTTNAPRTGAVTAVPLEPAEVLKRDRGLPFALGPATVFPSANDPDSRRATWMTSAMGALDHYVTPRLHYRAAYQTLATRRSGDNGPGGIGFQPLTRETTRSNGRTDTLQGRLDYAAAHHVLAAGLEWDREAFDSGGVAPGSFYQARVNQRALAVFGEDRWLWLGSRLQVTASGRYQRFALSRPLLSGDSPVYQSAAVPAPPSAFTGDASVSYRFERTNTKLRAHLGNAFRAPSLYERYGAGYFGGVFTPYGDPRLQPERSAGGDFGVDQMFGARRVRLSATYFYTQLRGVIGFDFSGLINRTTDPFGRGSGYFNTDGGLARGVETEAQVSLWRGFHVTASYTHTRTLERRAVAAGTLLTPRIYAHTASVVAVQTWRRLTASTNFLGSPEYLGVISGRAVMWPGPRRWDASVSYRLTNGEHWQPELYARGENLLGQTYYEDGFRTPGRWGVVGLRLRF